MEATQYSIYCTCRHGCNVTHACVAGEQAAAAADAVAADKCAKSVDLVRVAEREDARFQVASWTTLESSKRGVRVV